jgi:NADH dehydrogenase
MIKFLKIIFTWWNGQTIGTFLNTLFFGKLVGVDDSKNKYYVDSKDRRWVIFNSEVEATKIPPEWHAWIHHLIKEVPTKADFSKYGWQKDHQENKT